MNQKVVSNIYELAGYLSVKLKYIAPLFRPLYHMLFTNRIDKVRNQVFKKNALKVLLAFDECMNEYNHPYTLAFGTLLGAVREKGFIKHDLDIDTNIWYDDYSPDISSHLATKGFKLKSLYLVEDGKLGREETYELDGVTIDIFYIFPPIDKYPYCNDFFPMPGYGGMERSMKKAGSVKVRRLELPIIKERIMTNFENHPFPIPANANEILKFRYGDDYLIPNPNWSSSSSHENQNIVDWPEIKATYYHYD